MMRRLLTRSLSNLRTTIQRDGAAWPVPVLSTSEASALRSQLLIEMDGLKNPDFAKNDLLYYKAHLIFGAVDALARHPAIVQAAQRALGTRDLLLWDASIPLKPSAASAAEPAGQHFPWHQDGTYFGLEPIDGIVTCWVALSDASEEHGCMHVVPGSHAAGQQEHTLKPDEPGSMLRRGQQVEGVNEATSKAMALVAGEMSIHHPLALHCSGPNITSEARVGVVLNFVAPSTTPHNGIGSATLVAGSCTAEHWTLSQHQPAPNAGASAATDAASLEAHAQAMAVHRGELQAKQ
jgi:ectoine hydroxylase-related dioxygenase (phytanoyl-CoA dioxygenase family)